MKINKIEKDGFTIYVDGDMSVAELHSLLAGSATKQMAQIQLATTRQATTQRLQQIAKKRRTKYGVPLTKVGAVAIYPNVVDALRDKKLTREALRVHYSSLKSVTLEKYLKAYRKYFELEATVLQTVTTLIARKQEATRAAINEELALTIPLVRSALVDAALKALRVAQKIKFDQKAQTYGLVIHGNTNCGGE